VLLWSDVCEYDWLDVALWSLSTGNVCLLLSSSKPIFDLLGFGFEHDAVVFDNSVCE